MCFSSTCSSSLKPPSFTVRPSFGPAAGLPASSPANGCISLREGTQAQWLHEAAVSTVHPLPRNDAEKVAKGGLVIDDGQVHEVHSSATSGRRSVRRQFSRMRSSIAALCLRRRMSGGFFIVATAASLVMRGRSVGWELRVASGERVMALLRSLFFLATVATMFVSRDSGRK